MATSETVHYATLIRLQATVTALQNLLAAAPHPNDLRGTHQPDEIEPYRAALQDAREALSVAFGQRADVPASLTERWTSAQMVRDAANLATLGG